MKAESVKWIIASSVTEMGEGDERRNETAGEQKVYILNHLLKCTLSHSGVEWELLRNNSSTRFLTLVHSTHFEIFLFQTNNKAEK